MARELGFVSREAFYRGDRNAVPTTRDLMEWEVLNEIDPFGPERGDLQQGMICHTIDTFGRAKGEIKRPLDYMPIQRKLLGKAAEEPRQSEEEMRDIAEGVAEAFSQFRSG